MRRVAIYTDGACAGNPGPGGWAALVVTADEERTLTGFEPETTNNRMELRAAIEGLASLPEPCEVDLHTDSQYLQLGMTEWLPRWQRNGWRTAAKKAVKNDDLWRALVDLAGRHRIHWHWVRGHAGHPENERCDALANEAIRRGTSGVG